MHPGSYPGNLVLLYNLSREKTTEDGFPGLKVDYKIESGGRVYVYSQVGTLPPPVLSRMKIASHKGCAFLQAAPERRKLRFRESMKRRDD